MIDELDLLHLRGDRHFYESHGPRDHIHVACLRCGKVREVESEIYENLKRQIAKDTGIEITVCAHRNRRLLRRLPPLGIFPHRLFFESEPVEETEEAA